MKLGERFRVPGDFRLADIDPRGPADLALDKRAGAERLDASREKLRDLQDRLFAEGRWALLVVLQGMDTAGKDGVVQHVMGGINPQGCRVISFKAPTLPELRHDFLWRTACALPERGSVAIFNRSHYEDVVVVRVHQDLLDKQKLPTPCVTEHIWNERFESIRDFERHLTRNGTIVLKFFLHISKDEQKERLLARIDEADKTWKFNADDLTERQHWDDYMRVYEDAIRATSTDEAPWHVVPADRKWLARLAVAETIIAALEKVDPHYPGADGDALHRARAQLTSER